MKRLSACLQKSLSPLLESGKMKLKNMKSEDNKNTMKLFFYLFLLVLFIPAGNALGQSAPGMPPQGAFKGGPPPDEMGTVRAPVMGATKLKDKHQSDYFTDLNAGTVSINAYADYLYEKKLITDTRGDKLFRPDAKLTRGDFASMLNNKYKYAKTGGRYDDIAATDYYFEAITNGKACKIFEDTKKFVPEKPVTRKEMVLWIYRSEINNGMPPFMVSSDVSTFKDGDNLSDELKKAVGTLARMHMIKADEKGYFNSTGEITRAEVVTVLYQLSFLGSGPGGNGPGGPGGSGGMMPGGGHGAADHGSTAHTVSKDVSGRTFTSQSDDENAVRIAGDIQVTLNDVVIQKTAGQAKSGESCNFYGSNAAFLAMDGAKVTINKSTVESSAHGGNGIFSYGQGTTVTVNHCTIDTRKGSSGGIMVTGGGAMTINDSQIETQGRSSAALRTDRGGGTLIVKGGAYIAHGDGSPAIYCTADIRVSDATLTATTSEAVVIEGKNSVVLKNCIVSGNMIKNNVQNLQNIMIYQSMSGDAEQGRSSFTMENGSLTSHNGDMFYVTNTACNIRVKSVALIPFNDVFLKVVGNDARNGWGVVGKNGGNCNFTAENQEINGKIIVDEISTLVMSLRDGSQLTGTINAGKEGGHVSLNIDKTSKWTLSGDSYVTSLTGAVNNIDVDGHKLYVNGKSLKK